METIQITMQETLKQLVTATNSISVKLQELFDLGTKNNIKRDQIFQGKPKGFVELNPKG